MPLRNIQIRSALLSVYDKTGLDELVNALNDLQVKLYATGGTADFIRSMDCMVEDLSDVTGFPSILGGRVKTLHPRIFGGILAVRDSEEHGSELALHGISTFDMVIVDLYPFEQTVQLTTNTDEIIEKIDVGGISLLRAAAKNYLDVVVVPGADEYAPVLQLLLQRKGVFSLDERQALALRAFELTSTYDGNIRDYFRTQLVGATLPQPISNLKQATPTPTIPLRYGENPHQPASFTGRLTDIFTQLGGKELSYNNLLDLDAAIRLLADLQHKQFEQNVACAIFKHTNPCGVALRPTALGAWESALASDPLSAFGGVILLYHDITLAVAQALQEHFFEVLLAASFTPDALELLSKKKNRILLQLKDWRLPAEASRTTLNGTLRQAVDTQLTPQDAWQIPTQRRPSPAEAADLVLAECLAKHLKSNAIAIVHQGQLIGAGQGQTSRVDALKQALQKATERGFSLTGAVLASDGFFPFADSVELAYQAGIQVILEPGGSLRDQETIAYCQQHGLCLVITGQRHFRH